MITGTQVVTADIQFGNGKRIAYLGQGVRMNDECDLQEFRGVERLLGDKCQEWIAGPHNNTDSSLR